MYGDDKWMVLLFTPRTSSDSKDWGCDMHKYGPYPEEYADSKLDSLTRKMKFGQLSYGTLVKETYTNYLKSRKHV